jgi:hypothetical protein
MAEYRQNVAAKLRVAMGVVHLDFETEATLSLTEVRAILDDVAKIAMRFQGTTPATALIGTVTSLFGGGPVAGIALSSIGLVPEFSTRSSSDGSFRVDSVREGSEFFVRCDGLPGFLPSTSGAFRSDSLAGPMNIEAAAAPDIARQYASAGVAMQPRASTLVLELERQGGGPLEGVPVSDITPRNEPRCNSRRRPVPHRYERRRDATAAAVLDRCRQWTNASRLPQLH